MGKGAVPDADAGATAADSDDEFLLSDYEDNGGGKAAVDDRCRRALNTTRAMCARLAWQARAWQPWPVASG